MSKVEDFKERLEEMRTKIDKLKNKKSLVDDLLEKKKLRKKELEAELQEQGVDISDIPSETEEIEKRLKTNLDILEDSLDSYEDKLRKMQSDLM